MLGDFIMHIIKKEEIDRMNETLRPKLDESNLILIDDEDLSKLLKPFWFLQQCAQDIMANFPYSNEVILYSQYYWFVNFKNQYFSKVGYDGGMDQLAFLLIGKLSNELGGDVDWAFIEDIENQFNIEK